MKLVKIDDYTYVNPALIGAIKDEDFGANIYLAGSDKPIETLSDAEKVLDAISGSEEHSFIGYKKLKNKDLSQKAYVDVNNICGSEDHLVEYEDAENYRQDNNYSITVSNDNGGSKMIGTRPEVLSALYLLKNDETLTINRTKFLQRKYNTNESTTVRTI